MATVTRADPASAARQEAGLRKRDAAGMADAVITTIRCRLPAGEPNGLFGFDALKPRDNRERLGRNPRTEEEAPITALRFVTFRASAPLTDRVAVGLRDGRNGS